jgi:pimeloyl-ACP methyl ester carboxylesterase
VSEQTATTVRTPDGLHLSGTLVLPDGARQAVVLVHGGGVTREEGGFFARLAAGLAEADIASLRFDLRGHGESEGCQEDLTLAGILVDIRAAVALVCSRVSTNRVALLGASFSGGTCGYYATQHPTELTSLIMFNPVPLENRIWGCDLGFFEGSGGVLVLVDQAAEDGCAADGVVRDALRPPDVMEHPFRSKWSTRSGGNEAAVLE